MREDNFILYTGFIYVILQTAFVVYFQSIWVLLLALTYIVGTIWFINWAYTREVKIYSPIPVKLDGKWVLTFYVINGTHMILPEQLLENKLKSG